MFLVEMAVTAVALSPVVYGYNKIEESAKKLKRIKRDRLIFSYYAEMRSKKIKNKLKAL